MIKAIIFDVDDTLYDQKSPVETALAQTLDHALSASELAVIFNRFRDFTDHTYHQVMTHELTLKAWQTARLRHALALLNLPTISTDWAIQFEMAYQQALKKIQLFSGLSTTLAKLSHHFQIGIITNGPTEIQRQKLHQLQIERYVHADNIFIAETLGIAKPDPSIFTTWAHQAGIRANQAVYVGDNATLDMSGAKHAGWQTFWFNHRQALATSSTVIPDQTIETPDELSDLLMALVQAVTI
ncbi:HAD family hydrolase [Lactiplantibacillus mudanjiangensis]|uniref:HAD family hydrolase [Lactobacillus sp.] n=1 Tax=Lactiplantibacillus mudanjiangensis TaxID=1296538 RepID=A0A660DZ67_9LACO|nr:HAD family hydrolase [Lactiplantibacillus mudanjiangensis]VDG20591.1 HAD family hydrolase [Lactobacillus sp.] [Lactiplantibacillus mudanjiangensis]VDG24583.1 HAD family hydrolase [Lactobacillus sp.] [Lactiplantibacillus mudanjiangensis]VDG28632.1 HAD family hydrolase [Lactobacillus sp.] [Lactiplantibacillus mudanjiangensis]VDG30671.1 HAD family hydrolase [Lactobacillus sp.] [Lactiplantibacillus mudanjiangensis]